MQRVLVANRGEIAVRVVRACFDEKLESVVAVSEVDRHSLGALLADDSVEIGPAPATESYLSVDRIMAAAIARDCDAVHPGYGFLSERPELAEACEEAGIAFVGPPGPVMRRAGDKMAAREAADAVGIPIGRGSEAIQELPTAFKVAEEIGYPLMLKAAAGGGGRGMGVIETRDELQRRLQSARAEANQAFGDGRIFMERYLARARHIEVQILADRNGKVIHLGERDCSCQRRYQKLIEEAPAIGLDEALLERIRDAAVRLGRELDYVGAGTVEFLVDVEQENFIFLEVNARIQVEHPVSEMLTGVDIVRKQLTIAAGQPLGIDQDDVTFDGHVIECRINAEDPAHGFEPSPGKLVRWVPPQGTGVRFDTHCREGDSVPPYYDSLLGKLIVHAGDRLKALEFMASCLQRFRIEGLPTTSRFLARVISDPAFSSPVTTRWLEDDFLSRPHEAT